jgi:hypothetical protein
MVMVFAMNNLSGQEMIERRKDQQRRYSPKKKFT